MNNSTQPDPHPYHRVLIEKGGNGVTVCVYQNTGHGEYQHWYVDSKSYKKVDCINGEYFFQDYWQDFVNLETLQNVYKMLDSYIEIRDNVIELKNDVMLNFCSDDIPF